MHLGAPHSTYGSSVLNLPPPQSNYGFGGRREEPNPFGDYLEQTNQPWMSPDVSDETLRTLMGFVPVAGTAYNWDQMQPWERGLSIGMDAIDIATLGGGKAVTAPIKAATRFATRGDPALTYLRSGDMPTSQAGRDISNWEFPSYGSYFDETIPPQPQGNLIPSMNWSTGQPEAGISVYHGLQFPWDASKGTNVFMRPLDIPPSLNSQGPFWNRGDFGRPFYEVEGTPIGLGSDFEPLLDPTSAQYVKKFSPPATPPSSPRYKVPEIEFRNLQELAENPTIVNPNTGKSIDLSSEFAKYDPTGQKAARYRIGEIAEPWLQKPAIHPAVPVALPGRVPMQLYDSDEDGNYISTTGDKILTQLDELRSKYISPGGFTWDQLDTLVRRGEVSANQER